MQVNKIKQYIQIQQEQFQNFINNLRKPRLAKKIFQSAQNMRLSEKYNDYRGDIFPDDSNLDSLGSRSFYLCSHHSTQINNNNYAGDQTLKMRGKYSIAHRSTFKQFELPSHYFSSTKSKLQHHLKNSRTVPNVELLLNIKSNSNSKKYLFSQDQMSMLSESKVLRGQSNTNRLAQANPSIALKYCFIHELTESSDVKDILIFFVRLLEMLDFSITQPFMEKYKDCIYFGPRIKKRQMSQGLLYFFTGSFYFGNLLEYSMHGRGVHIFFNIPAVFKGDFKQNTMHGYFEVTKDNEKYNGMVENGVYHGHGRLVNRKGIVQGQFRQGKLIFQSKNLKQTSIVNFRIRETLQKSSIQENIEKNNFINNQSSKQKTNRINKSQNFEQKSEVLAFKQFRISKKAGKIVQFGSLMIQKATQQSTQKYQKIDKFARNNPEIIINQKKNYHNPQRLNGHLSKSIQTIRQETELGQQQPIQIQS